MYRRFLDKNLSDSLADTPVVLLAGARQTGKTTLVRQLGRYYSLDDTAVRTAVSIDPAAFLAGVPGDPSVPVVLDEVQLAPELFRALKVAVDTDRRPGRFLLTGSANVLLLPRLSESLAGRMEVLRLWPLAQAELEGGSGDFVDRVFTGTAIDVPDPGTQLRASVIRRALHGGYPEALGRASEARRLAWFDAYVTTVLQRDVREVSNIEGLTQVPSLLALLASRSATQVNLSSVSRDLNMPYTTLQRYSALLETTYLVHRVPAWSANAGLRETRHAKLVLTDTGLMARLLRWDERTLGGLGSPAGGLVETFVTNEILRLASWSESRPGVYHWRSLDRAEVDLVLEGPGGMIVLIEIKASSAVRPDDLKHIAKMRTVLGQKFHMGLVLYTGQHVLPMGDRCWAVPMNALWQ